MTLSVDKVLNLIKSKPKQAIMLWGPPGIGKSHIVAQAGAEMDMPVFDVRVSQLDPTDIRGIPTIVKDEKGNNRTQWAPPTFLPTQEKSILFFDEINHAAQSVQSAVYQIILDRRAGEYKLPKDTIIIAASNEKGSGILGNDLPLPLKNRFVHIKVRHDATGWIQWALRSSIAPEVVSYIKQNPGDLHNMPKEHKQISETKGFPTPRTWEFVSDILQSFENKVELPECGESIWGAIGESIGAKFTAYMKTTEKIRPPQEYIDNPRLVAEVKDEALHFFIMQSVVNVIQQKDRRKYQEIIEHGKIKPEIVTTITNYAVKVKNKIYLVNEELIKSMSNDEKVKLGIDLASAKGDLILPDTASKR